jgi:hypothetical protein
MGKRKKIKRKNKTEEIEEKEESEEEKEESEEEKEESEEIEEEIKEIIISETDISGLNILKNDSRGFYIPIPEETNEKIEVIISEKDYAKLETAFTQIFPNGKQLLSCVLDLLKSN